MTGQTNEYVYYQATLKAIKIHNPKFILHLVSQTALNLQARTNI